MKTRHHYHIGIIQGSDQFRAEGLELGPVSLFSHGLGSKVPTGMNAQIGVASLQQCQKHFSLLLLPYETGLWHWIGWRFDGLNY